MTPEEAEAALMDAATKFEQQCRTAGPGQAVELPVNLPRDAADLIRKRVARERFHPERVAILHEGAKLTGGQRDVAYGDPSINLSCSGELKIVFRKWLQRELSPAEMEAMDMVLSKIGRVATGPKPVRDTYVDGATYFAIAGEQALRHEASKPCGASDA